jgi:hypothetical protein
VMRYFPLCSVAFFENFKECTTFALPSIAHVVTNKTYISETLGICSCGISMREGKAEIASLPSPIGV